MITIHFKNRIEVLKIGIKLIIQSVYSSEFRFYNTTPIQLNYTKTTSKKVSYPFRFYFSSSEIDSAASKILSTRCLLRNLLYRIIPF